LVFHIITSGTVLGVKELMLQFRGSSIVLGIPVSEEKKNYISQRTVHCSVTVSAQRERLFDPSAQRKSLQIMRPPVFSIFQLITAPSCIASSYLE